jgi:aryl-alcohol dehydrogenase-like predicted oxidoreductase
MWKKTNAKITPKFLSQFGCPGPATYKKSWYDYNVMSLNNRYTPLPGSTLNPYNICLGTGDIGAIDLQTAFALLDAYFEQGGNFLDSAKIYADWLPGERSSSEKTIGRWLRARGNRPRLILATKGGHPDLTSMHIPRLSPLEIRDDLHHSLQNLQSEWIDLYWLHRDDPQRPVEEILETLHDLVIAGKIRYFGCSNWRSGRIRNANAYAQEHGFTGFIGDQMMWSMAVVDVPAIGDPTIEVMNPQLYKYHRETGLAAVPFTSQANGLFQKLGSGSFSQLSKRQQAIYTSPENLRRFERARRLAAHRNISLTQVVLSYLLSQPFATFPIIGPKKINHLLDSLSAADIKLEEVEIQFLEHGTGIDQF